MINEKKRRILIVDDDEMIQIFLKRKLLSETYEITSVSTGEAALLRIKRSMEETPNVTPFDLILCDLKMPKMGGIELMRELKNRKIEIPVFLMTAHGSMETAINAMREGAIDYILKPINLDALHFSLDKVFKIQRLENDNSALRKQLRQNHEHDSIIGKSRAIHSVFELVERVAPTQANVLISGESGTGKELVARALHRQSDRKDFPFVAINCSAIPSQLLESELFGHVKGSFTGAHQSKKGLFEEAQGGTIFLDEVGDMELALQAKLLRVLQERKIKPVGENFDRPIDVRIVAATHKNLRRACQTEQFREDLYYRLCVIPIDIPPLRQRKEDIPILAQHFLKKHAEINRLAVTTFTPDAISKLLNYSWPGNVRELENIVERSVILSRSDQISDEDITVTVGSFTAVDLIEDKASKLLSLDEMEKHYISLILHKTDGKKERASQVLGIDRKTLRRKIRDYQLGDNDSLMVEDRKRPTSSPSEHSSIST